MFRLRLCCPTKAFAFTIPLFVAGSAFAQTAEEKQCIFAAAAKLPTITGLTVANARAKRVPPNPKTRLQPGQSTLEVELDVRAAGLDATFTATCLVGVPGLTLTSPPQLVR
jgi:hypothetical protein